MSELLFESADSKPCRKEFGCPTERGEQVPFTHALVAALGGGGVAPGQLTGVCLAALVASFRSPL